MLRFNDIADKMLENNPRCDLELLQKAYVFSAKVHDGQERLSGEPYLIHPLAVAGILVDMQMDATTVASALLHDTLEDTLTTFDELQRLFGDKVAFLVEGVTKVAKIEFTSARERQAENFRKMLVAMSTDIRILLIKLADRLHNMRTIEFMKEEARLRIAQETLDIYVPLAHRLGIHWMKQELEEHAFRALKPGVAEELERQLSGSQDEREKYVQEVIGVIDEAMAAAGINCEVKGRLKELYSIHHKMDSQGIGLDQIYDVIAFRVICEGASEACYAALGVIHSTWSPVPGRFKDYIGLPKPNGYQSLHTTVIGPYGERMEVQIRTVEMDADAEYGIAAHWRYKEGRPAPDDPEAHRFGWLRQLLEWQRELADPHEFLDAVKMDLFPDEVFVFTPRGEVIILPRGATPLDFAYAIHSEVGAATAGAKVNGKMVPNSHVLVDGDTVAILTSQHQFPRKDWLDFVVSGKARNNIRHAIRAAEKERSRQLGRDILSRELRRSGLSLARLLESGELEEAARSEIRGGSVDDLFAAVSYGKISPAAVVARLKGEAEAEAQSLPVPVQERIRSLFKRGNREEAPESGIRVSGLHDVMVRFGGCCDPLPGDDVVGFVTRGRGVTVHSRGCPRVYELDPERRIEVEWDTGAEVKRKVSICVTSKDRAGILAKITNAISAAGINIAGVKVTTAEGSHAIQNFELLVENAGMLNSVMREIGRVKGVVSVERVRG